MFLQDSLEPASAAISWTIHFLYALLQWCAITTFQAIWSGPWLHHNNTLILCIFSNSVVQAVASNIWVNFNCWTYGLTFESRKRWYTDEFVVDSMAVRCPGLVAAKQAKIKTIPPPCLKVVWGVCARGADVLWLVFANNGTVHYDQTSPLLSHLSKRRYSTGLVVNLQIFTMLPCSREEASSWSAFLLTRRILLVPSFPDCAVMNFKIELK